MPNLDNTLFIAQSEIIFTSFCLVKFKLNNRLGNVKVYKFTFMFKSLQTEKNNNNINNTNKNKEKDFLNIVFMLMI